MRDQLILSTIAVTSALLVGCGGGNGDAVDSGNAIDAADPGVVDGAAGDRAFCPPLDAPTGPTVTVSPGESIAAAVAAAAPGTTILLADGTYDVSDDAVWFNTDDITLRSQSGERGSVMLDGGYNDNGSGGILNVRADNIVIASISLSRSRYHAIHVSGGGSSDTVGTRVYDVDIRDPGEQAIKINAANGYYADGGEIACSRIALDRDGEAFVTSQVSSGSRCYTGGVDAHDARDWVVRDNWIEGFWCTGSGGEYLSEHGIHFWTGSRDTVVERNRLVDNVRGIGFGLGPGGRSYGDDPCGGVNDAGHYGGIVRNNFIVATDPAIFASGNGVQEGISLWAACDATILHNTVAFAQDANSAIEWRFDQTSAIIANNLATDRLWDRGAQATLDSNLEEQGTELVVDVAGRDLHLAASAAAAIDMGSDAYLAECGEDIDGEARGDGSPDIGADELFP